MGIAPGAAALTHVVALIYAIPRNHIIHAQDIIVNRLPPVRKKNNAAVSSFLFIIIPNWWRRWESNPRPRQS